MENLSDEPVHDAIPDNIANQHMRRKKDIFDSLLNQIMTDLYIPFKSQVSMLDVLICIFYSKNNLLETHTYNRVCTLCLSNYIKK